MQHGNTIVTSFRAVECEIPIGTDSGLTEDGRIRSLKIQIKYPWVIKNFRVPMQSPGPEQISSGPGKGKPPGSYITLGSNYDLRVQKKTPSSKRPTGPEQPPGSKRPPGPKETSGFKTTSGSRATSGFKMTFGSKRNLRVQNNLRV